jgi:uncharacterized protein YeaO (DUF488 family)
MIQVKRVYDPVDRKDGTRFLVERLWPRGMKKDALHMDGWTKDVSPSDALRRWFGHDPAKWEEFRRRYLRQLDCEKIEPQLRELAGVARHQTLTLVYGARDSEHNQAVVLRQYLQRFHPGKAS